MAEAQAPLVAVKVEALVVMKIIKHCNQTFPTTATGCLVGMDFDNTLEITNSFPFPVVEMPTESHFDNASPNPAAAAPRAKGNAAYQAEMIRMIREVNIDANNVGWYTSANMGNFVNMNVIENQFYYQKELNERTVALVHDVSRSAQGALSLRAFRLSAKFMEAFKENKFTSEELQKSNIRHQDIFEELPVEIHNSHLITSFIHQLQNPTSSGPTDLPPRSPLLRPARSPNPPSSPPTSTTCPSALILSSRRTAISCSTASRPTTPRSTTTSTTSTKINNWKQKRAQENATRATLKQPLLPEDEWQRLFKLPAEPSRLESMLNTRQVEQFSRQVDSFVSSTTGKMFAAKGNLLPETAN
ncbi:Eukaryotic translation initiation factor 3 subunit H [Penicillium longicatenatum]|nr:Eukaryotic translation initiation factor 3 subunit H [Penicillium longicatenatum]